MRVDVVDAAGQSYFDAEHFKRGFGGSAQFGWKVRQQPFAGFNQQDLNAFWRHITEFHRRRMPSQFGDCACHFDTGRSAADNDEGQIFIAAFDIFLAVGFGQFQREQYLAADLGGICPPSAPMAQI